MMRFIGYLFLRFHGSGTLPNQTITTNHPQYHAQPTQSRMVDRTNQCVKSSLVQLRSDTCPTASTPAVSIVILTPIMPSPTSTYSSFRMNDLAIIFSSNILNSGRSRVTFEESYGLQNQALHCDISHDSPELAHIVTLWTKIVEVGVQWCCTSGPGCKVVAEYRSAEVALCARRELCVRCLSISFALGRLMQMCERGGRVQGSLGNRNVMESDLIPVVRVLPRLQCPVPEV